MMIESSKVLESPVELDDETILSYMLQNYRIIQIAGVLHIYLYKDYMKVHKWVEILGVTR